MSDPLSIPSISTPATSTNASTAKASSNHQHIHFISLISRNDKPLYIQAFDNGTPEAKGETANRFLTYNFLSHMALDVFSSPTSLSLREQQQDNDGVLLLFIQDEVTVYGYETNNELKIIVGMGISTLPSLPAKSTKPTSLKDLVLRIHKCYLRTIFNPFNNFKAEDEDDDNQSILASTTFDTNIHKIVSEWN